jgi:hypothetical protein
MKFLVLLVVCTMFFSQTVDEIVGKIETYTDSEKMFFKSNTFSFDWYVKAGEKILSERHHRWQIKTGDYQIKTKTKDGKELLIDFNINSKEGMVKIDGKEIEDKDDYLKNAYAWYINDSYWLIMPMKLRDKGVILAKEKMKDDLYCIKMTFENVGLTPGDQYWIYADKMGEIKRWSFKLEGGKEGDFTWEGYEDVGNGVKLAKIKNTKMMSIEFKNVKIK